MHRNLKMGASTLSLTAALSLFATAAFAQAAGAPAEGAVEEVVVTGSRIVTAGFQAPTPVTVVTTEALQRTAPGAIPEGLNQLPQFAGSRSNVTPGGLGNTPSTGNYLNLRNLGTLRNLVLLDGQRLPPTSYEGITDSNIIPQALVHLEHAHQGLSELVVVDTMHQRKALMAEYSDAYLSLAGGIGTLEEMAEMWTLNVLGYQNKPMALLNTAGYYDDYLKYLARMQAEGFASAAHLARLRVGQEPAAVLVDLLADLLAQV